MADFKLEVCVSVCVCVCVSVQLLTCVGLFATPWMVALQAPLSLGLLRQEYWNGLPFPGEGNLFHPKIEKILQWSGVTCIGRWFVYH